MSVRTARLVREVTMVLVEVDEDGGDVETFTSLKIINEDNVYVLYIDDAAEPETFWDYPSASVALSKAFDGLYREGWEQA